MPLGAKALELTMYREKGQGNNNICQHGRREVNFVNMLHYINNNVWKTLFNKAADGIEQSVDDDEEYRIIDQSPLTNEFISADEGEKGELNCANFIAGIIEGILISSNMPCKVSAHFVPEEADDANDPNDAPNPYKKSMTTLYVIKFEAEVIAREYKE